MARRTGIREAVREDGPAVAAMLRSLRGTAFEEFAFPAEVIAAYAGRFDCWATLLEVDGELAGVVLGRNRRAVLLYVAEAHRRKGWGRKLLVRCPASYLTVALRPDTVPALTWLKPFTRARSAGDHVVLTLTNPRKLWTKLPNPFAGLSRTST